VKEYGTLLADFEKNYAAIAPYALARDYFGNRTTQYWIIEYRLPIVSIRTSVQIKGEQALRIEKKI
jgi:hypothetical protein